MLYRAKRYLFVQKKPDAAPRLNPASPKPTSPNPCIFIIPAKETPLTKIPAENRYCLGALLLDINDPTRVLARSEQPIMEPIATYEQTGFFGNVVFSNGQIVDGDTIHLYYGASDEVICLADLSIKEVLNSLNPK